MVLGEVFGRRFVAFVDGYSTPTDPTFAPACSAIGQVTLLQWRHLKQLTRDSLECDVKRRRRRGTQRGAAPRRNPHAKLGDHTDELLATAAYGHYIGLSPHRAVRRERLGRV